VCSVWTKFGKLVSSFAPSGKLCKLHFSLFVFGYASSHIQRINLSSDAFSKSKIIVKKTGGQMLVAGTRC